MFSTLLFLTLAGLSAGDVWIWKDETQSGPPEPSKECIENIELCAGKSLVDGRCRTTSAALLLEWIRTDSDNDCYVTGFDIVTDARINYDYNGDGVVCRNEYIRRKSTYHNVTREYAEYEWEKFSPGVACVNINILANFESLELRVQYADMSIRDLLEYCNQGNNYETSGDCMGVPIICEIKRSEIPACKELYDSNRRTLKEKLDLNQRMNDPNNDGWSNVTEVAEDLSKYYDVDGSGCTERDEWVARWTSFYGFSAELANYQFDFFDSNGDRCLDINDVLANLSPAGAPSSVFPNLFIQSISDMCESNPALYRTNKDCAMVAETCEIFFPENPGCKKYVDQCGAENYLKCVQNLTIRPNGACSKPRDRAEVNMESLRLGNQATSKCTPYNPAVACRTLERFSRLFGKWFRNWGNYL